MVLQHPPIGVVRIRTRDWCLRQLGGVVAGVLSPHGEGSFWGSVAVICVADRDDLVFVVRDQTDQTWSLVWSEVTIEVTGLSSRGQRWVVRATGVCERERLPASAAANEARTMHPANGGPRRLPAASMGLRLRDAGVRGYSVLSESDVDG